VVVYTVFAHATQLHLDDGGISAYYGTFLLPSDGSVIVVPVCFLAKRSLYAIARPSVVCNVRRR